MTFLSYIRLERIVHMHSFLAGKHDAVTLKGAACWIAVATGIIYIKTSQEQKYDMNHLYELFCFNNWCSSCLIFPR